MTKELRLPLKTQWFEMTKAGIKKEDYREITTYWCSRLCKHWFPSGSENPLDWLIKYKTFTENVMTLGYPKSTDTSRIIKLEHKGIEIGYGKEEWGAEPNKLYFIIKHGNIINQ